MKEAHKIYVGFALNEVNAERYKGWNGKLKSAENDIHDMSAIAQTYGYDASRIYLGANATTSNLRKVFKDLRKLLKNSIGATVWFNFSGHGGQILDHETICLYDGQIIETDLRNEFFSLGKTTKVITLFDCCHAGGLDRNMFAAMTDVELTIKAIEPDIAIFAADNVVPSPRAVKKADRAMVKYLMACEKDESAFDGAKNGLFTAALKAVLASDKIPTYTQTINKASQYTGDLQSPRIVTLPNSEVWSDSEIIFQNIKK